jgi:hypothetical protein
MEGRAMSTPLGTAFKKPSCGDMYNLAATTLIRDILGGLINFQAVGTDPGVSGPVTGPLSEDYAPTAGTLNPDGTFFIIPETDAAVYVVEFADGTLFTITAVQSTAYLGQIWPGRVVRVLAAGTTGSFSVVY